MKKDKKSHFTATNSIQNVMKQQDNFCLKKAEKSRQTAKSLKSFV